MKKLLYIFGYAACFMILMLLSIMFLVNKPSIAPISLLSNRWLSDIDLVLGCAAEGFVFGAVHLLLMRKFSSRITKQSQDVFWAFSLSAIIGMGVILYIIMASYIITAMSFIRITWPLHIPSGVIHSQVQLLGIARILTVFGVTGLVAGILWIKLNLEVETKMQQ